MNFTSSLLTAARRPRHAYASRVLCDPGPSTLRIQQGSVRHLQSVSTRQRAISIGLRSFCYSSITGQPRPTNVAFQPRWVNTRKNGQQVEDESTGVEEGEESEAIETQEESVGKDTNVQAKGGEEDLGRGSSSSAPRSGDDSKGSSNGQSSSSGSLPPSPPGSSSNSPTQISKQSIPEFYPQVLALPIARRPLFPGFYKAVVVRNPGVVAAIKEMMKRGQPYLGAFLLKDENTDSDVITDINSVHHVGVFAQITSVFAATGKDEKEEGLTAVLYPHRRIKLTSLVKTGTSESTATIEALEEDAIAGIPTPPPSPPPSEEEHGKEVSHHAARKFIVLFTESEISSSPSSSSDSFSTKLRHFTCECRKSHDSAI